MSNSYAADPTTLPPRARAIRNTWQNASGITGAVQAIATPATVSAMFDALVDLENRLIALSGSW